MIVEFRPPLGSRASSSARSRWIVPATSMPRDGAALLRMASARPHEAEFFVPRVPIGLQRAVLRGLDRLGRSLPGTHR